jgi:RNA polymerase Rpb3/Rpb11
VGSNKIQESVSDLFVVLTISLSLGSVQNLQVTIYKLSKRSIEFDLVGVNAAIANALRRILIAEVRVGISKLRRHVVEIGCRSRQSR